jgi:hypothetical protein
LLYRHCRHFIRIFQILSWFADSQTYIRFLLFLFKYFFQVNSFGFTVLLEFLCCACSETHLTFSYDICCIHISSVNCMVNPNCF